MATRTLDAHYFADDKDIFDLLDASKLKLTTQRLIELARRRGLLLSTVTDREELRDELIEQIAILPFGWQELNALLAMTNTSDRTEKTASRTLGGFFSRDDLDVALNAVREKRQSWNETYNPTSLGNSVRIVVGYSDMDTSRTRLVQRTLREFTLEFDFSVPSAVVARHQDQKRAHKILDELVKALDSRLKNGITQQNIELTGVRDSGLRTEFFVKLMHGVSGFQFEDVKAVRASRFSKWVSVPQPSDGDEEDAPDMDEDSSSTEEIEADEATFVTQVKEIALKGDGLHISQHYAQLATDGFFVRSIVWTSTEKATNGAKVEFEAGFEDSENGTGFTYSIRTSSRDHVDKGIAERIAA